MVEDEVIAEQLERLLTPAITNQENYYRKLGLYYENKKRSSNQGRASIYR
jgi:hypothetical protein